jgi:hypothetical protein
MALAINPKHVRLSEAADPLRKDILEALAPLTPHLNDDERIVRYTMARELINHFLLRSGSTRAWVELIRPPTNEGAERTLEALLVEPVVGIFTAPATPR